MLARFVWFLENSEKLSTWEAFAKQNAGATVLGDDLDTYQDDAVADDDAEDEEHSVTASHSETFDVDGTSIRLNAEYIHNRLFGDGVTSEIEVLKVLMNKVMVLPKKRCSVTQVRDYVNSVWGPVGLS